MNILFYYPSNKRTISIESLIEKFTEQGHNLFILTQSPEDELHEKLKEFGTKTNCHVIDKKTSFFYYLNHLLFLVKFIKKNKINIVYSHLQQANIISVFAQYFCSAKIIICRHHSDSAFIDYNKNEQFFDKIINYLGKTFIVPSPKVLKQMIEIENVNPQKKKIHLIFYGYNFNAYDKPNSAEVEKIKNENQSELIILKAARFVPEKRHYILINALDNLINNKKLNIKAIFISGGPEESTIKKLIENKNLQNHILLDGFKSNIIDYIAAANIIVHLSESEASNSLIKEAGLLAKVVVVCKDVGDFDDYVQNEQNGFILEKENPQNELEKILENIYLNKNNYITIGEKLRTDVINKFAIENVIHQYDELNR